MGGLWRIHAGDKPQSDPSCPDRGICRGNGIHAIGGKSGADLPEPGEVVTEVLLPAPPQGFSSSYRKVRARGSWDFALAGVALAQLEAAIFHGEISVVLVYDALERRTQIAADGSSVVVTGFGTKLMMTSC